VAAVVAVTATVALAGLPATTPQPKMGEPILGLTPDEMAMFIQGQSEFATPFTVDDGLGPIFNEVSCGACHSSPLGGPGSTLVTRFGQFDQGVFDPLVELGGPVLQRFALDGACEEQVPPEANVVIDRVTPGALGYGLIEAIPDADLSFYETNPPLPGISGRAHIVFALEDDEPRPPRVGRFGWKSSQPTMKSFTSDAELNEMGLTNQQIGEDNDPNGNPDPLCDDAIVDPELPQDPETLLYFTDRVSFFMRYLAAPPQTPRSGMSGEAIFDSIGCTACHVSSFTTSATVLETALQSQTFRPYSDFLLHDMGGSADGMPEGDAEANEMRTTPLWGLRTRNPLWHDGVIFSLDFTIRVTQAIEAHGAPGSEPYVAGIVGDEQNPGAWDLLPAEDQAKVIAFLASLGRLEFDVDGDELIGLDDFLDFNACFTGPGSFYTPDDPCAIHDIDQDGDVDEDDYASFLLVYAGPLDDCNTNSIPDITDIVTGTSNDVNVNGVPDDCELCATDLNQDAQVNFGDILIVLGAWGACGSCPEDIDGNGVVAFADILLVIADFGPCPPPPDGACCFPDGSCTEGSEDDCATGGGTYQGHHSTCAGVGCAPVPTGACCFPDASCVEQSELDCLSGAYADGSCTLETSADCVAAAGTYVGNDVTCAAADCPQPSGACCFPDSSCSVLAADACNIAGGVFQGEGVTCAAANCPFLDGACCAADGTCTVILEADCLAAGGDYLGDATICADCPDPTGACCLVTGACTSLTEAACLGNGGVYQGHGSDCAGANCQPAVGACCFDDAPCTEGTFADCFFAGGSFEGADVTCAESSCAPLGACCFFDGTCTFVSDNDCTTGGGTYQGDGIDCAGVTCLPSGACCLANGTCTFGPSAECNAVNGTYQGDGVTCAAANCPQPGACCAPNGFCSEVLEGFCNVVNGVFQGEGVDCGSVSCPQPWACCFSDGSCALEQAADCAAAGGTYQGDGTDCAAASCPQPGACCFDNGACSFFFESTCLAGGGIYQGDGVSCAVAACPQPGACCLPGGACTDGPVADCVASGGFFRGEGTTCAGVICLANDFCSSPELVPCNTSIPYDNTNASPQQDDGGPGDPDLPAGSPSCQWNGVPTDVHNTLWYSFVAGDTSVEVQTCPTLTNVDTVMALYDGSCGSLVQLACSDDGDCGGAANYRSRMCYDGLVPGNTYVVMVGNPGSWTGSDPGATTLEINCPCPDVGPVVGACCFADETCADLLPADCTAASGLFQGAGNLCAGVSCENPTGACCQDDGTCTVGLQTDCIGTGGSFQGAATTCGGVVCPQPGACCLPDASCLFVADFACAAAAGAFAGEGAACATIDCPTGFIDTIAGTGTPGYSGDGGPGVNAEVNTPDGVAIDSLGRIYIADSLNHRIRRIGTGGNISTFAGTGIAGYTGNGGPANNARLNSPEGVFVDANDNVYIADTDNNRVRRVDAGTGIITLVAGNGGSSYSGDGGPANVASLRKPQGVCVDGAGNVYIADTDNQRIRYIDNATGIITTIVGTGSGGSSGDGGPATAARVNKPEDVFLDAAGDLYIADRVNSRVRRVDGAGIITTVVGTGVGGYSGDGGPATDAQINQPSALAITASGFLFIADKNNHRIRRVDLATGIIETVAGDGTGGFGGDGGPATAASLQNPQGVAATPSGDVVIGDTANHRVREADLGAD
jgi:sugar lactone lactonase YvrE